MCYLSKTDYISGMACNKRLWLEKNRPEVCKKEDTTHTRDGNEVGALAREYFPNAVTVPLGRASEMAQATKDLMMQGHTVICEATFIADGRSCSADIVLVKPDGLELIEVKSSTSVKDVQREDAAFQCYVIEKSGHTIRRARIMHLNSEYVRGEELDIDQLFTFTELSLPWLGKVAEIERNIKHLEAVCQQEEEPEAELACRCEKPYECPCKDYCFRQAEIPAQSVFNMPGMTAKKKYELYSAGIITPEQLCKAERHLTPKQMAQAKSFAEEEDCSQIRIDKKMVSLFLQSVRYPLHLLDFETMQTAVPRYRGTHPYSQVPFQYSLHITDAPHGSLRHEEFLAEAGIDPRRALAEKLCQDIPMDVQSMAYNSSFEKSVCRHLADVYPNWGNHLRAIADNMIDLMIPFRNGWVTSPAMHGSYSIKAVLPALCGNDPELDYHKLPVAHNGAEAMEIFGGLHLVDDSAEVARIRAGLSQYCHLDTLAMVKILDKLFELCN